MNILTRLLTVILLLEISIFFNVISLMRVAVLLFTKGPRKLFTRTKRDKPPEQLSDPSLGTHGYLHLEEVRIHYVSNGSDDKPLLLLLHGFPESWYSWRYQLKEFADSYRVVAVDLRGYGESDKPCGIGQYKMDRMVNDVKQIITGLGYQSCVLAGHDWGGAVTWAFSGCYPDMVDKVIVLNCPHPHGFLKYMLTHWAQFKKSCYMFFIFLPVLPEFTIGLYDLKFFDDIFLNKKGGILTGATTKEDVEVYKYLFRNHSSLVGPLNYYRAHSLYGISRKFSQKLTKPVLIVWGCRDAALEKDQVDRCHEFADNITVKYLENASHWVQMDEPDQVNKHIREFLSGKSETS